MERLLSFIKTDLNSLESRRWFYFKIMYPTFAMNYIFFFVKYNFQYNYSDFNIPLFILFAFIMISPLLYRVFKSYKIMACYFFVTSVTLVALLVYLAGGLHAPGVFWIAIFPMVGGVLLGRKGIYLGLFFSMAFLSTFFLLNQAGYYINIITLNNVYEQEKKINVFIYIFYNAVITYYFIQTEERALGKISNQKGILENLLRILIHDLSNSIFSIQMRILKNEKKFKQSKKDEEDFKKMNLAIQNATDILHQIRNMKALKDGKIKLNKKKVDLDKIIYSVIELLEERLKEKNIIVTTQLIDINGKQTFVDEQIIKNQVLMNILSNALKFSHPQEKIEISGHVKGDRIYVSVRDHGIGMPQKLLNNIFTMHKATTRTGTSGEPGTGYGLPLVKQFIDAHGGDIEVSSIESDQDQQDHGTTVTISLPLAS